MIRTYRLCERFAFAGIAACLLQVSLSGCSSSEEWTPAIGQHGAKFERQIEKTVGAHFLLFLPEGFGKEARRWPLIVFLHGSGERGDSLGKLKVNGLPELVEQQKDFPFIVISPQLSAEDAWSSDVIGSLIDETCSRLPVDTDRVYLTGLSLGGEATWACACDMPWRFAAIAPVSGAGDDDRACRLKHVPVWVFHGEKDPFVPIMDDSAMVIALKKCGGEVKFTVYPGGGHDAWTQTYANPDLYAWFLAHRRVHHAHED